MSKRENYEKKAEALILTIINKNNYELVDVEFVRASFPIFWIKKILLRNHIYWR